MAETQVERRGHEQIAEKVSGSLVGLGRKKTLSLDSCQSNQDLKQDPGEKEAQRSELDIWFYFVSWATYCWLSNH